MYRRGGGGNEPRERALWTMLLRVLNSMSGIVEAAGGFEHSHHQFVSTAPSSYPASSCHSKPRSKALSPPSCFSSRHVSLFAVGLVGC